MTCKFEPNRFIPIRETGFGYWLKKLRKLTIRMHLLLQKFIFWNFLTHSNSQRMRESLIWQSLYLQFVIIYLDVKTKL